MPIINKVWYPDPACSDAAVAPFSLRSAIMGNYYSYSHINYPSHDVSPTIHFGNLVFEHQGDFNLQLTGIYDPDLTCAGREVFTSFSHIPKDLADSATRLDLDYNGSDEEVDPYEGRNVYMAT
jgi:hypothetical protein